MMERLRYERLTVGVTAVATAEQAVAITTKYVKERTAFGKPLIEFQNTRFKLAECATEAHVGRVFLDHCIERFIAGELDDVTTAMAKYWLTDCQCRVVDECVQLHGGYGYMTEYPIARMWTDSRVQRIYAGTNEIMKELIGWSAVNALSQGSQALLMRDPERQPRPAHRTHRAAADRSADSLSARLIEEQAARSPHLDAVVFEQQVLTYAELERARRRSWRITCGCWARVRRCSSACSSSARSRWSSACSAS